MFIQPAFKPSGAAATLPPRPQFKAEDTLDTVVSTLNDQWESRMQGQQPKCTVGIFVERGYKPTEAHDDVLQLADAVMDAGGFPSLLYINKGGKSVEQQLSQVDALLVPGGRDWDPTSTVRSWAPIWIPTSRIGPGTISKLPVTSMPWTRTCRSSPSAAVSKV